MKIMHKKIIEKILMKIKNSKGEEYNKYTSLYKIVTDKYHNFFSDISMDIALEILKDLDYDEKDAVNIYQELILEDINSTYILVSDDTNSKIIK